jgi:protein-disulfide isomerase
MANSELPQDKPHLFARSPILLGSLAIINLGILLIAFFLIKYFFIAPPPVEDLGSGLSANIDYTASGSADQLISKNPNPEDVINEPIISENDPMFGSASASNTIVIFADYACEFCGELARSIASLVRQDPEKIKLYWKDYPDSDAATPAFKAAISARCAGEQGEYWKFSDKLFILKGNITDNSISSIAKELAINEEKFKACLKDDKQKTIIEDNIFEADALQISGLPTIFINGKEFMGQMTEEELKEAVKQIIQ